MNLTIQTVLTVAAISIVSIAVANRIGPLRSMIQG